MKQDIQKIIKDFKSATLATTGPNGLNVVPISVVEVCGEEIHLYDFFMRKTAENVKAEPRVAFACWHDFVGLQIKADAVYETEGEDFERAVAEMKKRFPDRTLSGLIKLTPVEIYDVAPEASADNILSA
ncbi:MAG: pyridoxamine 5'-phosphate oxidase family protein [Candidatus Nomurabacteria bacterium]|nr:MAG: pyridoxamine 5'-phosphate oxidase family protein [Candidatus Nomurabacteria bacterium]